MKTQADYDRLIVDTLSQWNKAEEAIKIAEHVNGDVVNPAIYELRYAGRRIIEAEAERSVGNFEVACQKMGDAFFDCCRAQHDAIDAATAKIGDSLNSATKNFSPKTVISIYPQFTELYQQLSSIRSKISESRKKRDCRDTIYDAITNVDLPRLTQDYEQFIFCAPLMKRQVAFERWALVVGAIVTLIVGVVVGLVVANLDDDPTSDKVGEPVSTKIIVSPEE